MRRRASRIGCFRMSEPQRTEAVHPGPPSEADRAARIEQLLLAGLDQYFGGRYEQAIDIWTRVAFLERGHGRARAYIERARGALAERQRESDEWVHDGVAAYRAGDVEGARALLTRAVEQGGVNETALLFLHRLGRLDTAAVAARLDAGGRPGRDADATRPTAARTSWLATVAACVAVVAVIAVAGLAAASWLRELPVEAPSASSAPAETLPLVHESDLAILRARALYADGRFREALDVLEAIGIGNPSRGEADRLRADAQRALLAGPGDVSAEDEGPR
jgi:tetratricopeptide (TPR) repeat protein